MRKRINDIRIRARGKEENTSMSTLRRATGEFYPIKTRVNSTDDGDLAIESLDLYGSDGENTFETSQSNFEELASQSRRKFLKIMLASGGVLLAGSFLNKINKFQNMSLVGQTSNGNSVPIPVAPEIVGDQDLENDYQNFFNNFRLVKNKKEYILYNKYGDNILTIDRDV